MLDGMGSNGPIIDDSAKNGRTVEFDGEGMRIEDMEDTASPLEGIADSVMGDIMRGQVSEEVIGMPVLSAFCGPFVSIVCIVWVSTQAPWIVR